MSGQESTASWRDIISFPLGGRQSKPRDCGLTMVIDKGMGIGETRDLLQINYEHIDFIKLGFGTPALYAAGTLEEKIQLARSYDIEIYPGGTFMEVAIMQNKTREFLCKCKSLGFTAVEISDGTVFISQEVREQAIFMAAEMGFRVLTEVGKKNNGPELSVHTLATQAMRDLEKGSYKVILEGRECGINVGLYDQNGQMARKDLKVLLEYIDDPALIIWEAPLKNQQQDLIEKFGPNVNLGNIQPQEVLAVEALRVGLRADTLQFVANLEDMNI
ncbi:phosphosulfolactate synthase [Desulfotomaculum arcticum]|uniref:Phosphosulfolactate synthase n=1 Tax=Desulfotruncus arcticus DSM 17038 TaxID=1121424 RepID=A0A1I2XX16_9FIRM|nr:phosphosulfolactate synthase [Desulfotruncus arcticus]SFH18024.1 phosphosulfolactate synthase [Desulfotomaculum arcticum] [Desulfotruncus arcticus DSM 17038]